MKIFKNGLLTGLVLQLAIGPVFFFIINLTLQRTILDGLVAALGAMLADYVYILLAIFGIAKFLEIEKVKKVFGVISSIVLTIFGIFIIKNALMINTSVDLYANSVSLLSSFIYTFFLTLSSPLTIFLWTGLFATKAIEYNYSKNELFIFGFSTGLATFLFIGTAVVIFSLIKQAVPIELIQVLNIIVGCLLVGYGVSRLIKVLKVK